MHRLIDVYPQKGTVSQPGPGPKRRRTAMESVRAWANEWPAQERIPSTLDLGECSSGVIALKLFYFGRVCNFLFLVCVCVSKPRRYFANLDMLIFLGNEVKHDFVARWVAQPASRWPLDRANDDEGNMPHVLQLLNYSHQCLAC